MCLGMSFGFYSNPCVSSSALGHLASLTWTKCQPCGSQQLYLSLRRRTAMQRDSLQAPQSPESHIWDPLLCQMTAALAGRTAAS